MCFANVVVCRSVADRPLTGGDHQTVSSRGVRGLSRRRHYCSKGSLVELEGVCDVVGHKCSLKKVAGVLDASLFCHTLEFGVPAAKSDVGSTPSTRSIGGFSRAPGHREQGIGRV